ncbi:MAG: protein-disulfide reductase DsbD domain-containing protein [Candidatus Kapaibacterium sp.]
MKYLAVIILFIALIPSKAADSLASVELKAYNASHGKIALAAKFEIKKDWHIYWKNPGDAGMPTTIDWTLPEGFSVMDTRYGYPIRFATEGITSFGYKDSAFVIYYIEYPQDISGSFQIKGKAKWLACKEKCLPGSEYVAIEIPFKNGIFNGAYLPERINSQLPEKGDFISGTAGRYGGDVSVMIDGITGKPLDFFPLQEGVFDISKKPEFKERSGRIEFSMGRPQYPLARADRVEGLLIVKENDRHIPYYINFPIIKKEHQR